jgi:hypothetical protein
VIQRILAVWVKSRKAGTVTYISTVFLEENSLLVIFCPRNLYLSKIQLSDWILLINEEEILRRRFKNYLQIHVPIIK